MPSIHDHANKKMVKQCLPLLHQETSDGIQPERGKENALLPKFQAHPIFHTRVAPDDPRIRNHPEMPRLEEMLVATLIAVSDCPHSLATTECLLQPK
jgi:hypothetical protein